MVHRYLAEMYVLQDGVLEERQVFGHFMVEKEIWLTDQSLPPFVYQGQASIEGTQKNVLVVPVPGIMGENGLNNAQRLCEKIIADLEELLPSEPVYFLVATEKYLESISGLRVHEELHPPKLIILPVAPHSHQ